MRRALISISAAASCLLFIVIVIGSITIVAQSPITGDWRIEPRSERTSRHPKAGEDTDAPDTPDAWDANRKGDLNVQFDHWRGGSGHNSIGSNFTYAELGLTAQQVQNGGPVRFRLAREAGTVDGEGTCASGTCKGTFTFAPNMGFVTTMKSKGFDFENPNNSIRFNDNDDANRTTTEERLLTAALLNVTTALADDLNSANFGKLDTGDLFKAAIFHIDGKYAAEMKATGFPNLSFDDLVKGRIFKIDANYVRQVHEMGFDDRSFEGLVKFRIFKVTPEFLNELKTAGLANLSSEDIVKARIFHIDADYVRKARSENPNATMEDMVRMKIGVGRNRGGDWQ